MKSLILKYLFVNLSLIPSFLVANSIYTIESGTNTHIPKDASLCADIIEVKSGGVLTAYNPSNFCVTPTGSGTINYTPHITSNGGGLSATINLTENIKAVTTVTSNDLDGDNVTYSIFAGEDKDKFKIDSSSGELTFLSIPDYENPTDKNTDNTYLVEIRATDDGIASLSTTQKITIIINDGNEVPVINSVPKSVALTEQNYTYNILASDYNNDILSWSINEKPSWLEFSANKKQLNFAGTGVNPISDKNGTYDSLDGTDAKLSKIKLFAGALVATNEKVFFGDQEEYGVRYIDEYGKLKTLLAGDGKYLTLNPKALACDEANDIMYIANYASNGSIYKYENSVKTQIASNLQGFINSLLLNKDTNKLYAGTRSTIYEIDLSNNSKRVIAGNEAFHGNYSNTGVASSSKINTVASMAFDKDKKLIFVDRFNRIIRKIDIANDTIETIAGIQGVRALAGDGASAKSATFEDPSGLAINHQGRIFISERLKKKIRVINTNGNIEHFADITASGFLDTLTISPNGNLFIGTTNKILQLTTTPYLYGTPSLSDVGIHNVKLLVSDGKDSVNHDFQVEVKKSPDNDNDGISDINEGANDVPPRDSDGDNIPDYLDTDSDNDGILDINEGANENPPRDSDKDGIPDYLDKANAVEITNNASQNSANINILENERFITKIKANGDNENIAYKIIGGADKDLFELDENSGELNFKTAANYENPSDANSDNIYSVQIEAYYKDAANIVNLKDTQTINVQVLNAHELLTINSTAKTDAKENEEYTYAITTSSDDNKTQINYETLILPSWLKLENTNNYTSKKIVSPNFSIDHSNDITDYLVEISTNYLPYKDKLSLDESLASSYGISSSYDNAKGILKLSGTTSADNWEKILRTVEITLHKDQSATRSVNFSEGLRGDILSLEKNGVIHYYELVKEKITWDEAKTKAEQKTFQGKQGYLVTITSEEENELLNTKVNADMWIGASDSDSESIWKWVTGPEKGQHFFTQTRGFRTSPHLSSVYNNKKSGGGVVVNNKYNNWARKEPNDWGGTGEPNAHIRANGQWNDYPAHFKAYYIVEYGGMSEDSNTNITQVVKVTKEKTYILKGTPKVAGRYDVSIKASQNKLSDTQNFTIEVENKNDAPVLNTANFVIKENAPINTLLGEISAIDEDNISPSIDLIGKLQSITYSIEKGNTNNTFILDANTGELKLNKALNAYENSRYILEIKAEDEEGASSKKQFVVKVTNLDDKPVSNNDVVSLNEDTSFDIEVLANDSDRDNNIDVESVKIKTQTNNGKLEVQASGKIKYTPNKNFNGNDSFTYEVYDTTGLKSNESKVDITVNSVNDAPITFNKVLRTNEDIYLIEDLANLAFDADGDALSFETQEAPTHGSVSYSDGVLEYIPNANYYGSDSFTFNVKDSSNNTSNTSRIYVNIAEVNDIPVALDDEVSLDEDTNITIDVLANDVDDEGLDTTSLSILKQPENGLVNIQAGKIIYTPNANFSGEDSFLYTVKDTGLKTGTQSSNGVLISNAAKVNIKVNAVNDIPSISGTPVNSVNEDSFYSFKVNANDVDLDDTLTYSIINKPSWAFFDEKTGRLSGIPSNDDVKTYSNIQISVEDSKKQKSSLSAFNIEVVNVNDAPRISGTPSLNVNEDSLYSFTPSVVEIDKNDSLIYSIENKPAWASFDENTGRLSGTPRNEHVGEASNIVISVEDAASQKVSLEAFNINIVNTNDSPSISGTPSLSVNEDSLYSFTPSASDMDIGDSISFEIQNKPAWANFDEKTGRLSGTPRNEHVGQSSNIVILAKDKDNAKTALNAFNIEVVNVNDAPNISGTPSLSVNEDSLYSFTPSASDMDLGDSISFEIQNKPTWANFDEKTGKLSGTPRNEHVGKTSNIVIFVKDKDNAKTALNAFNIEVVNTNDAPSISGSPTTKVNEDKLYSFTPSGSDMDLGDSISFKIENKPSWALFDTSTGTLSGTPKKTDLGEYLNIIISVEDKLKAKTSLPSFNIEVLSDLDKDGIADKEDSDKDNDGIEDIKDLDDDNDGIPDIEEGSNENPPRDSDNDGIPDYIDVDSDNDGVKDIDEGKEDSNKNGIPDYLDKDVVGLKDSDNDGIPDSQDSDDDNDGISDIEEGANENPLRDSDKDGIPDYKDLDSDNDGVKDIDEGKEDSNKNGIPDYLDKDVVGLKDSDNDGIADKDDNDDDNDGIADIDEGANEEPLRDSDNDGIPDYKDGDSDNDGILDSLEKNIDTDKDGIPDYLDTDSNNDGVLDEDEGTTDTDGDGILDTIDKDDDNDGIPDSVEGLDDIDKDGIPNSKDRDSDGDGKLDIIESTFDDDLDGVVNYLDKDDSGSDDFKENSDGTKTLTYKKVAGSGDDKTTKVTVHKDKIVDRTQNDDGSSQIKIYEPNSTIKVKNDGGLDILVNENSFTHKINVVNEGADISISQPENDMTISTPVYVNADGSTCQYDVQIKYNGNDMVTKHYLNKGLDNEVVTTTYMKIPNASLEINSNNEVVHIGEFKNTNNEDVKVTGIVSCDGSISTTTQFTQDNSQDDTSYVAVNKAGSTVIIDTDGKVDTQTPVEVTPNNEIKQLNFNVNPNTGKIKAVKVYSDNSEDEVIYPKGARVIANSSNITNVQVDLSNVRLVTVDVKDEQNKTITSKMQVDDNIALNEIKRLSNGEDGSVTTQVTLSNDQSNVIEINNMLDGKVVHKVKANGKISQASSSLAGANTNVTSNGVSTKYDDSANSGVVVQVDTNKEGKTEHILRKGDKTTQANSNIIGSKTQIVKDKNEEPKIVTQVQTQNSNSQLVDIQVDANADGTAVHKLKLNEILVQAVSKIVGALTTIKTDGEIQTKAQLDNQTDANVYAKPNGSAIHEVKTSTFDSKATFNIVGANTQIKATKEVETTLNAKSKMCQTSNEYVITNVSTNKDGKSVSKFDKYSCSDDSFIKTESTISQEQAFEANNDIEVSISNETVEISTKTDLVEDIKF